MTIQSSLDTIVHELSLHKEPSTDIALAPIWGESSWYSVGIKKVREGTLLNIDHTHRSGEVHFYEIILENPSSLFEQRFVQRCTSDKASHRTICDQDVRLERTVPVNSSKAMPFRELLDAAALELQVKDHEGLEYNTDHHFVGELGTDMLLLGGLFLGGIVISAATYTALSLGNRLYRRRMPKMSGTTRQPEGETQKKNRSIVFSLRNILRGVLFLGYGGVAAVGIMLGGPRLEHNIFDYLSRQHNFRGKVQAAYEEVVACQSQAGFVVKGKEPELRTTFAELRDLELNSRNNPMKYVLEDITWDAREVLSDIHGNGTNGVYIGKNIWIRYAPLLYKNRLKTTLAHERGHHYFAQHLPQQGTYSALSALDEGIAEHIAYLTAKQSGDIGWIENARDHLRSFTDTPQRDTSVGFDTKIHDYGSQFVDRFTRAIDNDQQYAAILKEIVKNPPLTQGEILCPLRYARRNLAKEGRESWLLDSLPDSHEVCSLR